MTAALSSAFDVSGAAHLPAEVAAGSSVGQIASAGASATLLRLEGTAPVRVVPGGGTERATCGRWDQSSTLDMPESIAAWREVRDVAYFKAHPDRQIWRLSVPPAAGAEVVAADPRYAGRPRLLRLGRRFDLAGAGSQPRRRRSRSCAAPSNSRSGHATLIRAAANVRSSVPVFHPQPTALAALASRVKESFDPKGLFNPGRMRLAMQTNFTLARSPIRIRSQRDILRKCVHCGFCTATCPTYVLLGDECDSPRGRIYLIKAMLEGERAPTASVVKHVDRCLRA